MLVCFSFHSKDTLSESCIALGHDKAQSIIDHITSAYESGGGPPPGGFGFGPHHLVGPPPPPMGFGPPGGFNGRRSFTPYHVGQGLTRRKLVVNRSAEPPFPPPAGGFRPPFPPNGGMPPPGAFGGRFFFWPL